MSNFDVLGRKLGYQNQCRLNAFYSVQGIFMDLSVCLYIYVCPCCYLLFYFYGFYRYDRRDEQTNKRTNERTDGTAIPNTVYPSLREMVV
jgi:hypothetical protein